MYVVAGVSGNTGSVVADTLLKLGKRVRVIVRDEKKGDAWKAKGAEVAVASLDDEAALARALSGATGAYYLLPPDVTAPDVIARGRRFIDTLAHVLEKNPIPHVAYLSSIAAQHVDGTGPIKMHHYGEQKLRGLKTRFTFIRAAYFMENYGMLVAAVTGQGVLPVYADVIRKFPQVATKDIGETAARALLEPPSATEVIELSGPRELSYTDAAEIFAAVLGKSVHVVRVPDAEVVPQLTSFGLSQSAAANYLEMFQALDAGKFKQESSGVRSLRGSITLEAFAPSLLGK